MWADELGREREGNWEGFGRKVKGCVVNKGGDPQFKSAPTQLRNIANY
jgi:hypothetical protein